MAKYTTEQLLTSELSTTFYSTDVIDSAINSLSGEIGDIIDTISVDINPKVSSIANAVSAHIKEVNDLSAIVSGLTGTTSDISDLSGDVDNLKAINAQLTAIEDLPTDGSISSTDIINKINEILRNFTKQS